MTISKLALPRRTFLRGLGATVALPLLDAMVPAGDGAGEDRCASRYPAGLRLHPQRCDPGAVRARRHRRRVRAVADPQPPGAGARPAARAERPRPPAGRLVRRRQTATTRGRPRRGSAACMRGSAGGASAPPRSSSAPPPTSSRARARPETPPAVARARARETDRHLVRLGRLLLLEHHLVARPHDAARDGAASPRGVRAALRRRRQRRRTAAPRPGRPAVILDSVTEEALSLERTLGPSRPQQAERVPRLGARPSNSASAGPKPATTTPRSTCPIGPSTSPRISRSTPT